MQIAVAPTLMRRHSLDELAAIRLLARRKRGPAADVDRPTRETAKKIAREVRDAQLSAEDLELLADRPRTRAECVDAPRPCGWVSCRHHLLLDVSPETGSIKLNWEDVELAPETCSLDVAEGGSRTLDQVGALLNVTRERTRQLETAASEMLRLGLRRAGVRREDLATPPGRHATNEP